MTAEPNPETATDALVVAARSDREALGRLYDVYYPRIFGYCLRRLFARTAAEDATADVFLRVASHLPTFPGRTVEDFQFDVELDESLFSLTLPKGYKIERREHDMTPLTEGDFLEALRWASEIRDGRFPDALTTEDYVKIILAYNEKWKEKQKPGEQESPTRFDAGRGFTFPHILPISTEPHYAGKGVSLDEKDRPVF